MAEIFSLLAKVDLQITLWIQQYLSFDLGDWFFPLITDLHKASWFKSVFVFPLLGLWLYVQEKRGALLIIALILNLSVIDYFSSQMIKKTFARPRPFVTAPELIQQKSPASGYSMISNHAANIFGLAFFISAFFPMLTLTSYSIAFLVAYSRVYNGVHYFSDVFLGALLGTLFSWYAVKITRHFLFRKKEQNG